VTAPAVLASGLAVGYGAQPVVADLDLDVEPGQSQALVGVNGSGKSTLLKTLAGLLPPVTGTLEVFGAPPGRGPRRVAYLGQFHSSGGILPLQVRDVVLMARYRRRGLLGRITREDHHVVARSLERVGIGHLAAEPLRSLSGGQRQRAYLAQVLAAEADLVLLDEPTAGLDAGAGQRYLEIVDEELERGACVVIATHDLRDAARCDQVVLLAGRVVAAGRPGDVLRPEQLLEAFGVALTAVPHLDHTDLTVTENPHGHEHPVHPGGARA
jgi:ABC-type Mn2+/Zn2+ transport system ATPase subunit